jgi:hypothetical protein
MGPWPRTSGGSETQMIALIFGFIAQILAAVAGLVLGILGILL